MRVLSLLLILVSTFTSSCSQEGSSLPLRNAKNTALTFCNLMSSRNYDQAFAMTSKEFQQSHNAEELQSRFEDIVPRDWGEINPIEVGETMTEWPAKEAADVAWVYVVLGSDVYSEALILVITDDGNTLKVRDIEYGRP